ncbi:acyl-coenzyme A thioesterase THEM4-like [Ptychodera flava]|uniref:acyl-coenzyme A thioesterase THEM4-like n=1 Tax=Ptychodera flava TaxID=63121 RepID=UPI00396A02F9
MTEVKFQYDDPVNEGWLEETKELYYKLNKLTESGDYVYLGHIQPLGTNLFCTSLSVDRPGQIFEYAKFVNKREGKLKGVCQFGPLTEGPPQHVHGGAIATIVDSSTGKLFVSVSKYGGVTTSLTLNYKRQIPLMRAVLIEAEVTESIDDRKYSVACKLKSADGQTLYVDAFSKFIIAKKSKL